MFLFVCLLLLFVVFVVVVWGFCGISDLMCGKKIRKCLSTRLYHLRIIVVAVVVVVVVAGYYHHHLLLLGRRRRRRRLGRCPRSCRLHRLLLLLRLPVHLLFLIVFFSSSSFSSFQSIFFYLLLSSPWLPQVVPWAVGACTVWPWAGKSWTTSSTSEAAGSTCRTW